MTPPWVDGGNRKIGQAAVDVDRQLSGGAHNQLVRPLLGVASVLVTALLLAACSDPVDQSPSPISPSVSVPTSPGGPTSSTTPCTQNSALDAWPTHRLAAQVLVAPAQFADVAAAQPDVTRGVGGLILFGSTPQPDFTTALDRLTSSAPGGVAPFVMTDEEGGAVQRALAIVGPVPSARRMARTMTPAQIETLAFNVGTKLLNAGITMDLAPVLDLDNRRGPTSTNPDGTRSFGMDVARTTDDGIAFAKGLQRAGVTPVVKHFPGLGHATGNTDNGPAQTLPWESLASAGLDPFRDAVRAGLPAVMVANASVPGLTDQPASISAEVINRVLRDSLGFDGLVLTDSVSAFALRDTGYSVPAAAVAALGAGADLVLFGTGRDDNPELASLTVRAIEHAVRSGALSRVRLQDAVGHVLAAKQVDLCATSGDSPHASP
jgi:beta-N-acetylhexosaminidase